jgi:hypothetical protein
MMDVAAREAARSKASEARPQLGRVCTHDGRRHVVRHDPFDDTLEEAPRGF